MGIQAIRDLPPILVPRLIDRQATRAPPIPVLRPIHTQATWGNPLTPVPRPMVCQGAPDTPPNPVLQAMDTRARRPILPTPVPIMGIPWLAIPAIALMRTGRLEPSTPSSLLAE